MYFDHIQKPFLMSYPTYLYNTISCIILFLGLRHFKIIYSYTYLRFAIEL